jgi:hypothetical protein
LNPGTYVLTGTPSFAGATLTGTGVTFYVPAGATAPDFSGVLAGSSLSPPSSSGTYPNVLYYQVPSNTTVPKFTGGLTNISGLIYAPGATAVPYCCTTGNVVLVFGSTTFSSAVGNSAMTVTIPSSSNIVRRVVIVE